MLLLHALYRRSGIGTLGQGFHRRGTQERACSRPTVDGLGERFGGGLEQGKVHGSLTPWDYFTEKQLTVGLGALAWMGGGDARQQGGASATNGSVLHVGSALHR